MSLAPRFSSIACKVIPWNCPVILKGVALIHEWIGFASLALDCPAVVMMLSAPLTALNLALLSGLIVVRTFLGCTPAVELKSRGRGEAKRNPWRELCGEDYPAWINERPENHQITRIQNFKVCCPVDSSSRHSGNQGIAAPSSGSRNMSGRAPLSEKESKDTATILAEKRTDLAMERTMFAAERNLMAWIRTALSMIGSGFALYKFFQYLPEELATGNIRRPNAPRNLGLTLIALGTLALAAAAWQHRNFLQKVGPSRTRHVSVSFVIAIAVILTGCITFYGVLLRSGPF